VGRGINDFRVQCDESINTPDVIDRNELRARIGVQPIRAAEFIFIEFSIFRTGGFDQPDTGF
jgi:phage tail sheath protein FI